MDALLADLSHAIIRFADLPTRKESTFSLVPNAESRAAIAAELGLNALKKLRFEGKLAVQGKSDWRLTAQLGASVVQDCVITLDPVNTRIDEDVERIYLAEIPEISAAETEMDTDETVDALPVTLDLNTVMIEALSLAIPPYPRRPDADLGEAIYTEKGTAPMTDQDARPFAGLSDLRKALEKKGNSGE